MTPLELVVGALDARDCRPRGSAACCPAHDDRNASLSFSEGDDGRVLLHCHAGCKPAAIVAALGLTMADLFPEQNRQTRRKSSNGWKRPARLPGDERIAEWHQRMISSAALVKRLADLRGWTPDVLSGHEIGFDGERVVIPVRGAQGALVGVQRYQPNPQRRNGQDKMLSLPGSRRDLFPAPERVSGEPLFVTEGEPDALTLLSLGIAAVAVPGAQGWRNNMAARFAGRDVVVCCDCDEPGRRLAAQVAGDIRGRATSVRVLDLDESRADGFDAGDLVRDAVRSGPDQLAAARERLLGLAANVEPARLPAPEDAAELLDGLVAFVRRFVVLSAEQARIVALWIVHAHALDAADSTPYLAVTSAEKRSGKSRLLEVMRELAPRPLVTANVSDAALFRAVHEHKPTLLFDEVDAIFSPKARDREDLRGMLNAGHRRGAKVLRCGGPKMTELQEFDVFGPKVLAGIGELPDTVADRSIPVRLQRKAPGEHVERARQRQIAAEAAPLREHVAAWAAHHVRALTDAEPALPDELDDRAQDGAEPLLAIADLAGGEWPQRARRALVALLAGRDATDDDSIGVRLLADIRAVFDATGADRVATDALLERLAADDEAPWAAWGGSRLTARGLGGQLKRYAIRSRSIRLPDGSTPKGYLREQFEDAFRRYLPAIPPSKRHNATTPKNVGDSASSHPPQEGGVADRREAENADEHSVVADMADSGPPDERERTVADLGDHEVLAIFPGSRFLEPDEQIESPDAPHDPLCAYPTRHAGRSWRTHNRRLVCSVCHPPAHTSLVAGWAA